MTLEEYTNLRKKGFTKEQILAGAKSQATKPKTGPLKAISNDIGRLSKGVTGLAGALAPVFPQIGAQLAAPGILRAQDKALKDKMEIDNRLLEIIKRPGVSPERKKFLASLIEDSSKYSDFVSQVPEIAPTKRQVGGAALQTASLFTPVGKIAGATTGLARAAGLKTGATALGNVVSGGATGYGFDVASKMLADEEPFQGPGLGTLLGVLLPGVGTALNVTGRAVKNQGSKILGKTTELGEGAFKRLAERPEAVQAAQRGGATIESSLKNIQGEVRNFRNELTRGWQQSSRSIIEENTGIRASIPSDIRVLLKTTADEFGIKLPQNLNDVSAREAIKLLGDFNALKGVRVAVSPKGAGVRTIKPKLKEAFVKAFGGKEGNFSNMYNTYAVKSEILGAADDIVRAYKTKKPKVQQAALNNLEKIFTNNKTEYLKALIDLEKATGKDLLSQVAGARMREVGPVISSPSLRPVELIIDLALFPLTSPRTAAFFARNLGKIKAPSITFPGDKLLKESPTVQAIADDVSTSMRMPGLGMSIRPIKNGNKIAELQQTLQQLMNRAQQLRDRGLKETSNEVQKYIKAAKKLEDQIYRLQREQ